MQRHSNQRGIALVLTLSILVIATILVVGFATSMRTERQASASMASSETARSLAQSAVDHAIGLLENNIPQPVAPGAATTNPTNWLINPGLLTLVSGLGTVTEIPLSSNPGPAYVSGAGDAELNPPQLNGVGNMLVPAPTQMRVAWVPILRDPSTVAAANNKITGRYAFWIDDESAKVNINTAVGKPSNPDFTKLTPATIAVASTAHPQSVYPLGHPSSVNLDVLGPIDTNALASAVEQQEGLRFVDSIKPFVTSGSADQFLQDHRFHLSAFSRSPEFDVFGKSRFYLFKQITHATGFVRPIGWPLFQPFRDKDAPMYFHGDEASSADTAAMYYTADAIAQVLNRSDWPGMPARSFVDKWDRDPTGAAYPTAANMGKREADQVAWNIISLGNFSDYNATYTNSTSSDYVFYENKIAAGKPGTQKATNAGTVNYPNTAVPLGPLSQKAIVPAFPRPLVNEICLTITLEPFNPVSPPGVTKYRLKISIQTELRLGPGYPDCNYAAPAAAEEIGLTYFAYNITQTNSTVTAAQEDTKYITASDKDGIRSLYGSKTAGAVTSSSPYVVIATDSTKFIYARNGSGFSPSTVGPANFNSTGLIHCNFKMRLFAHSPSALSGTPTAPPVSLVPVWDARDPGIASTNGWNPTPPSSPAVAAFAPPSNEKDYIEYQFDLDPALLGGQQVTRSLEIEDPRTCGVASKWQPAANFTNSGAAVADSLGKQNHIALTANDASKMAWADFSNPAGTNTDSVYRPSTGMFSLVPTGMQRGLVGSTLKLQPSGSMSELPDWLLLDLFAPTVYASNYPALSTMNSTAGRVNINAAIYPTGGQFTPPERWQPLQAVFQHMSPASTVSSGANTASTVVDNIVNHRLAAGGNDFGAPGKYDYLGEVCEIAGVADTGATDWDKEQIIRYVAPNLTTQSNVFSVYGVAQTLRKLPSHTNYGSFEGGDVITGEKRFVAVVERYVWPGIDSTAGNGHVDSSGRYDSLSANRTTPGSVPDYAAASAWEKIDGPDGPTYPVDPNSGPWNQNAASSYQSSQLDKANNPLAAHMKYRVISFRYLDE